MKATDSVHAKLNAGFGRNLLTIAVIALCVGGTITASAQTKPAEQQNSSENKDAARTAQPTYRLLYTLTENDGTKRVGVQHFALSLNPNPQTGPSEIRLGSRVPITTGTYNPGAALAENQIQYIDVGLTIRAGLREYVNGFMVDTEVQQSSIVDTPSADPLHPVIRQATLRTTALLTPGKPVVIGSLDTPGSTRHLDIEVVLEPVR